MEALTEIPEIMKIDADSLIKNVVKKDDFARINGKIEIKRDLALKLFAASKLSYTTEVLPAQIVSDKEVVYMVKARVFLPESRIAEGLGACSTREVEGSRKHHDSLSRAETRAFKRALETCIGLPVINEIIERLFGVGKPPQSDANNQGHVKPLTSQELTTMLKDARNVDKLKDVWAKYHDDYLTYPDGVKRELIKTKNEVKATLSDDTVTYADIRAFQHELGSRRFIEIIQPFQPVNELDNNSMIELKAKLNSALNVLITGL